MEKVLGIGGLFFRSEDPEKLGKWYRDNLGVNLVPKGPSEIPWKQEAGTTVFSPFPSDTEYLGKKSQMWMVNFRVRDLNAMVSQLKDSGISVEKDPETYPHGSFARLHDPEGNPIELWEPVK